MMMKKIVRVTALSIVALALPGVIAACSGGDAGATSSSVNGTESNVSSANACTNVAKHDDSKCQGGSFYLLLDEINDESCQAMNDTAEEAKAGGVSVQIPSSIAKASAPTFSWGKATAERGRLQRVLDLLEPSAEAHGRTDGDVYMLVFEDKSCTEVLRIFTKQTSYKPDASAWSKLTAASGPVTLTVVYATLDNSAVKDGTSSLASKPATFTIK